MSHIRKFSVINMRDEKMGISELFSKARQGDSKAFEEVYRIYFKPVFRYIFLRVEDKATAEDLTQDVFLKIFKYNGFFEDRGKDPLAFFFVSARNVLFDYLKEKKKIFTEEIGDNLKENLQDEKGDQEEFLIKNEEIKRLNLVLSDLSEEQKEVVSLRFFGELSFRQIAEITGKNEEAVRQIQSRALKLLRRIF